jgi:hypothetical protein
MSVPNSYFEMQHSLARLWRAMCCADCHQVLALLFDERNQTARAVDTA